MERTVTIVPGSSNWWLVTLSPLLFYDTIRICNEDINIIFKEGCQSSYHNRVAVTLDTLLNSEESSIIIRDTKLPTAGCSKELYQEAKRLAKLIISYSGNYTPSKPTLISPSDLKKMFKATYTTWIKYNTQILNFLDKTESFAKVLKIDQIPQSQTNLNRIIHLPSEKIPDLLETDLNFRKVFEELIRNAILIMSLINDIHSRAYDTLIEEFLPVIELVERLKIFHEYPEYQSVLHDFFLLSKFYDFRIRKVTQISKEVPNVIEAVRLAFKGRRQFSLLRKHIAELDSTLIERNSNSKLFIKEVTSIVTGINKSLNRIDKVGAWGIWLTALSSSIYLFSEIISSSSPLVNQIMKSLIFNPYTTMKIKEVLQNFTLAKKGFKPSWNGRIALIRDFIIPRISNSHVSLFRDIPTQTFKFWV